MQSDGSPPVYLVPLIVGGALTFFVLLWSGISLLLARLGGYRSLAAFRSPDATTGEPLPGARFIRFGLSTYKGGTMTLTAAPAGLGIHVHRLFPGHPDLRVPWDRVDVEGPAPGGVRVTLDGRAHMTVPPALAEAIAAARTRFTRGA